MEADAGVVEDEALATADEGERAGRNAIVRDEGREVVRGDDVADRLAFVGEAALAGQVDARDLGMRVQQIGEAIARPPPAIRR